MIFMQKGFATLEIFLVIMIIAILATTTIPSAARIIDRVSLDYETKRLYTDLRFIQSFDRMAYMQDSHFKTNYDEKVNFVIAPDRYVFEKNSDGKIYTENYFSKGVTASLNKDKEVWQIIFDDMDRINPAKSDTLTLSSKFGSQKYFKFDTVGRFRGSLTP